MKTDELSALPAAIESFDVARRVTVAARAAVPKLSARPSIS